MPRSVSCIIQAKVHHILEFFNIEHAFVSSSLSERSRYPRCFIVSHMCRLMRKLTRPHLLETKVFCMCQVFNAIAPLSSYGYSKHPDISGY